jgi:hypothetical protein
MAWRFLGESFIGHLTKGTSPPKGARSGSILDSGIRMMIEMNRIHPVVRFSGVLLKQELGDIFRKNDDILEL